MSKDDKKNKYNYCLTITARLLNESKYHNIRPVIPPNTILNPFNSVTLEGGGGNFLQKR